MRSLRDVQSAFAAALFTSHRGDLQDLIDGSSEHAAAGIAVYRRNVRNNLVEALRAVYPVIERLVGEAFFGHVAGQYVCDTPSASGDIHRYGASFVQCLATHPATAHLPYLGDTAQLEWLVHEIFHAADAPGFDPAMLATILPEKFARLTFRLHPACRLLASPYPVDRIWHANQPGADDREPLSLAMGAVRLLVARRGQDIALEPLAPGEYAMLSQLGDRTPLGAALEAALRLDPGFDLAGVLRRHVSLGTLIGGEFAA